MAKRKRSIGAFVAFALLSAALFADPGSFSIHGSVKHGRSGDIIVKLLDGEQFVRDVKGEDPGTRFTVRLKALEGGGDVPFEFTSVPAGIYAISSYQDINGNGKCDLGPFGPLEPWGYSGPRPMFFPSFRKLAINISDDLAGILIEIK